jgi:LemA protein
MRDRIFQPGTPGQKAQQKAEGEKAMSVTLIVVAVAVFLAVVWLIALYNGLIRHKNIMREAWSGIDVQLMRRHDLIPNLVSTVQGYMTHERTLLENLSKYRAASAGTASIEGKAQAENQISQGLRQLFAVAEAYPDLKANTNFLDLQAKLAEVEDQIQLARRYYNGATRNYNIAISSFPGVLVAGKFGFGAAPYFEIAEGDRAVPAVDLGKHA